MWTICKFNKALTSFKAFFSSKTVHIQIRPRSKLRSCAARLSEHPPQVLSRERGGSLWAGSQMAPVFMSLPHVGAHHQTA